VRASSSPRVTDATPPTRSATNTNTYRHKNRQQIPSSHGFACSPFQSGSWHAETPDSERTQKYTTAGHKATPTTAYKRWKSQSHHSVVTLAPRT
jgi:hypothetical protein